MTAPRLSYVCFVVILSALCACQRPATKAAVSADCLSVPARAADASAIKASFTREAGRSAFEAECPPGDGACEAWRTFRQSHPYPYQAFAARRAPGGKAVLIVSEPPPEVSHDDATSLINELFADRSPVTSVKRWMIGSDGYLEDIVTTIDAPELTSDDILSDTDLRDRMALLNQAWFGTSCGGDVETIGDSPPTGGVAPDLSVSAAELNAWITDKSRTWIKIEDPSLKAYSLDEFNADAPSGAYKSSDGALALFVVSTTELTDDGMNALRVDFRRFAVSSDDVIGATWSDGGGRLMIVGRGRTHPLSQIPPLRFETFAQIVAQRDQPELSQSYERNNPFAGPVENRRNADWAPIYLSPALRDSEFGALLNITDQMLKSWSEAGVVDYLNFNYPKPITYPFGRARLSDLVLKQTGSEETLFNWNTTGLAATVALDGRQFMVARALGALPITYGADLPGKVGPQLGTLLSFEDSAYDYYAKLGDPNLARVVQYTLIYQAIHTWSSSSSAEQAEQDHPSPSSAYLAGQLKKLLDDIDSGAMQQLLDERGFKPKLLGQATTALQTLRKDFPTATNDKLAPVLADRNGTGASQIAIISTAQGADPQQLWADDTARLAQALQLVALGQSNLDLSSIQEGFEKASDRSIAGWIRTPSDVVSWSSGVGAPRQGEGGHNLVAKTTMLTESSGVQGVVLQSDGTIAYNPAQAEVVSEHASELARAVEHKHADQSGIDAIINGAALPPRPILDALAMEAPPASRQAPRLGGLLFDDRGPFVERLRQLKTNTTCCTVIARDDAGLMHLAETSAVPPPVIVVTGYGDTASLGLYLKSPNAHPPFIFVGERPEHIEAMMLMAEDPTPGESVVQTLKRRLKGVFGAAQSRADIFVGKDLNGRLGSIAARGGDPLADVGALSQLQAAVVDQAVVDVLGPDEVRQLMPMLQWNPATQGDPLLTRVRMVPKQAGGPEQLDVVASFASGANSANETRLGDLVRRTVSLAEQRGGTIAAVEIQIKNELRTSDVRRLAFVVRQGSTQTQFTLLAGPHAALDLG